MENMTCQKINRFRMKIHRVNVGKILERNFDGVIRYLKKHLEEFQKYQPDANSSKNMAGQKITRFRAKIHNASDKKHFDALIKYLQKHLEEFQKYKPPARITISSSEQTPVSSSAPTASTNSDDLTANQSPSSSSLELELPKKVQKVDKILDDADQYKDVRFNSINKFAEKHLMRVGTDELRHSLIKQYLNQEFKTIIVTNFQDEKFQKIFRYMGEEAQFRAKSLYFNGCYYTKKKNGSFPIFTNGLILSLAHQLQLKIRSPEKNVLKIEICNFHIEELEKENGDYSHWNSHRKPQVTFHKAKRTALKTLHNNSTA